MMTRLQLLALLSLTAAMISGGVAQTAPPAATVEQKRAAATAFLTPLVLQTGERPNPVKGSDGRYHLVYELTVANFTADSVHAGDFEVLDLLALDEVHLPASLDLNRVRVRASRRAQIKPAA